MLSTEFPRPIMNRKSMSTNNMRLEKNLAQALLRDQKTVAIAESCTGGLLCNRLTNIPGSSAFFWLGVIAYDYAAKVKILKVPPAILKKHGAVSAQVASCMAANVRKILKTDYGIAITGIAGPGGATPTKPVGLVFIAASKQKQNVVKRFLFKGSRLAVKTKAAEAALHLLLKNL